MSDLTVSEDAGIIAIRFDRPHKKNALTLAMYRQATTALRAANSDGARAVMILGHPGSFTAGNDLADFVQRQGELGAVVDFLDVLSTVDVPVLAGVDGVAIGIGTTLLLHCDVVLATARSVFRTPFVDLGLVPEGGSSLLLPRLVGPRLASEMLLEGRAIDGATAAASGLVSALVEPEALEPALTARALGLGAKAPAAVRASKALLRGAHAQELARVMAAEVASFRARLGSADFAAAAARFLSKG